MQMAGPVVGEPGSGVRFGVLGPLQVVDGSGEVKTVTAAKQRIALAALLLSGGRVVSAAGLAEALWDTCPPPNASAVMRTYVMRLRRALGAAGARITGQPSGWAVDLRYPEELDLTEVDHLRRAARAAAEVGEWSQVSSLMARGLSLWRGEPLADVPSSALTRREAGSLAELWLHLTETRIDADLRLGRHREVVTELRRLTAGHPLREHLWGQLMLACYRCGDQAGALEVYRDAYRTLSEELGVSPGRELHELHQKILSADPDLALGVAVAERVVPSQRPPSPLRATEPAEEVTQPRLPDEANDAALAEDWARLPLASPVVPRQLPVPLRHFAGRAAELEWLSALTAETSGASPPVVISAIGGMAGVGKTALALQFAHQVADRFPDGQLYVNLRGFDPDGQPVPAAEAMSGFLASLGVNPRHVPPELDSRVGLYRSLLAGRRMLIMLDNACEAAQVRPLLPGSGGCLVIVTSRNLMVGLAAADGAQLLTLDVLDDDDAAQLLVARAGPERVAAEPAAAAEIAHLCGRLPLALAIAAARAAARPAHPLTALAGELRDVGGRLDALDAGEAAASTRAVLSWSCRHLSTEAVRMLRLLGIHPGPDISAVAAASLAGVSLPRAHGALRELRGASMLGEYSPDRYTLHDLVRCYATELAYPSDGADEQRETIGRVIDHYLHTGNGLLAGSWRQLELAAPHRGVTPEVVTRRDGPAWFDAEHKIMLRLAEQAAVGGFGAHVWQLPWIMTDFLDRRGDWQGWAAVQRAALAAATQLEDRAGEARSRHSLGQACIQLRDYADGRRQLRRALDLYAQMGDRERQAHVHICCCVAFDRQHRPSEALTSARKALDLLGPYSPADLRATALNNLGCCYASTGDYQRALVSCAQARDLYRKFDARFGEADTWGFGEADTWDSMGYVHQCLGEHTQAIACYQRALRLLAGNRYKQGRTTVRLGDAYEAAGQTVAAQNAWQQALAIFDHLHHADTAQLRAKLQNLRLP